MPIYPYKCKKCGQEFDVIKSKDDIDRKEKCESCGSIRTSRVMGLSAKVEVPWCEGDPGYNMHPTNYD